MEMRRDPNRDTFCDVHVPCLIDTVVNLSHVRGPSSICHPVQLQLFAGHTFFSTVSLY